MGKIQVRFGIKTNSWLFPYAGVVVFKIDQSNWVKLVELVNQLKMIVPPNIGDNIVCEVRN